MRCNEVQSWALTALKQGSCTSNLDKNFYQHTAECASCRGALLMLALVRPTVFPPLCICTCTACQADLPTLIDSEQTMPGAGIAAVPAAWWHALSCPRCARILALLLTLCLPASAAPELHSGRAKHFQSI